VDLGTVKKIAPPTVIASLILFGVYGPLPNRGAQISETLQFINHWSIENLAYPFVFYFGIGLAAAWAIFAFKTLVLQRRRTEARLALEKLRTEGTAIRIECDRLTTQAELTAWIAKSEEWEGRAVKAIAVIDVPDSKNFATIDFPGKPRADLSRYLSKEHRDYYAFHDARQVKLDELIRSYRERLSRHD
jgi:hypothetical protein